MQRAALTASGVYTAPYVISNEELVAAYNQYARGFNAENAARIVAGEVAACAESSVDFIEKASGITRRYVMDKAGVLDPQPACSIRKGCARALPRGAMKSSHCRPRWPWRLAERRWPLPAGQAPRSMR